VNKLSQSPNLARKFVLLDNVAEGKNRLADLRKQLRKSAPECGVDFRRFRRRILDWCKNNQVKLPDSFIDDCFGKGMDFDEVVKLIQKLSLHKKTLKR